MSDIYAGLDYIVTQVSFQDEVVEIAYFDKRKQRERVALVESIILPITDFGEQLRFILTELEEIVDEGHLAWRQPPDKISPKDRLKQAIADENAVKDVEPNLETGEGMLGGPGSSLEAVMDDDAGVAEDPEA